LLPALLLPHAAPAICRARPAPRRFVHSYTEPPAAPPAQASLPLTYEERVWARHGASALVCGVDEAGRGPLPGPDDNPNRIDVKQLNDIDRRLLKESLRAARHLQQRLQLDYQR
jgi:hypothetical protein